MNSNTNPLVEKFAEQTRWVFWKNVPDTQTGKPRKIPFQQNGIVAKVNDQKTWSSLKPPPAGMGVGLIIKDGLLAVDLDDVIDGHVILDEHVAEFVLMAGTYTEVSPSKTGLHLYFMLSEPFVPQTKVYKSANGAAFEIYVDGRWFAVTQSSWHDAPLPIRTVTKAEAEELLALLGYPWRSNNGSGSGKGGGSVGGNGNNNHKPPTAQQLQQALARLGDDRLETYETWVEVGMAIKNATLAAGYGLQAFIDVSRRSSKFNEQACKEKWTSFSDDKQKPLSFGSLKYWADEDSPPAPDFDPDDVGNATAFIAAHTGEFLFNGAMGWLMWNGTHWEQEFAEQRLREQIALSLQARRLEAVAAGKEKLIVATKPSATNIKNCFSVLSARSELLESAGVFDANPDEINCANGVLNLRTGELIPHDKSQRFTYCLSTAYDPTADTTEINDFLLETLWGGEEAVEFLQSFLGYCLTGHTSWEKMVYIYGPARSGKGTLLQSLNGVMEELSHAVSFSTLVEKRTGDSSNFDLAGLRSARLIYADEGDNTSYLDAARAKLITGGGKIRCCHKYHALFEYAPQFKVIVAANHSLKIDVDDDAAWDRIIYISFPTTHIGEEENPAIKQRFISDEMKPAWLAWLVAGAQRFYAAGAAKAKIPVTVQDFAAAKRDEIDFVKAWLSEEAEMDRKAKTVVAVAQASYTAWCEHNGVKAKQGRGLADALRRKGIETGERERDAGGKLARIYRGFKLTEKVGGVGF